MGKGGGERYSAVDKLRTVGEGEEEKDTILLTSSGLVRQKKQITMQLISLGLVGEGGEEKETILLTS